jgi:hypothetical protein
MNLPSNYKKQLQAKKDKKAQINKQINSVINIFKEGQR